MITWAARYIRVASVFEGFYVVLATFSGFSGFLLVRNLVFAGARFLSARRFSCLLRCYCLSRREKKAAGLEQHKKLMREKDQKRKQKKQVSLPAKHSRK
jgi:hypothetical protein